MFNDFFVTPSGFVIPNPFPGKVAKALDGRTLEEIEDSLLENVREKQKAAREAIYDLVVFYNQTGRKEQSIALLSYLTDKAEDPGEKGFLYFTTGQYMEQISDFEKAVDYYQKAFALEPSNQRIWYFIHNNLGYSLNRLGRYDEGERFCRIATKINPRIHNAYKNLGIALEGQGRDLEAAKNYIEATKANAADDRPLHHLEDLCKRNPQLLQEQAELREGLEQCREAVRLALEIIHDPKRDTFAKNSLVRVKINDQEDEDAVNKLREQLEIPRDNAREMGIEAMEIIKKGHYLNPAGIRIEVGKEIQKAVDNTVTYAPDIDLPSSATGHFDTIVTAENTSTLAAARQLVVYGFRPAALNMASATSPGGGFLSGARAQEEYLCRSSALFACLKGNPMYQRKDFYLNLFYDDYVIYSPDVPVFRNDDGELLERPFSCSILTSPAVFASAVQEYMPDRFDEIEGAMWRRILRVLSVAHTHGHDALVLGAWGCGAFGNDGQMVARLFKKALDKNFTGIFKHVVFAIADWSPEKRFIGPFRELFDTGN